MTKVVSILLAVLGIGVLNAYAMSRRLPLLLGGLSYACGGICGFWFNSWWPVLIGFLGALLVRFVLGDPDRG